jgi:hypothetical protein
MGNANEEIRIMSDASGYADSEPTGPSYQELLSALVEGERVALGVGSDWPSVPSEARFPLLKWPHNAHRLLDQLAAGAADKPA